MSTTKLRVKNSLLQKFLNKIKCEAKSNDMNQKSSTLVDEVLIHIADLDSIYVFAKDVHGSVIIKGFLTGTEIKENEIGEIPIDIPEVLEILKTFAPGAIVTLEYDRKLKISDAETVWSFETLDSENIISTIEGEFPIKFEKEYPVGRIGETVREFNNIIIISADELKKVVKNATIAGKRSKSVVVKFKTAMTDKNFYALAGETAKSVGKKLLISEFDVKENFEEIFSYGLGNIISNLDGKVELYFGKTQDQDGKWGFNVWIRNGSFDYYLMRTPREIE